MSRRAAAAAVADRTRDDAGAVRHSPPWMLDAVCLCLPLFDDMSIPMVRLVVVRWERLFDDLEALLPLPGGP